MRKLGYAAVIGTLVATTAGCATNTPPLVAQDKTYTTHGQKLVFGGTYDKHKNLLTILVNGDPVMRGEFPPFTPKKVMHGTYKGMTIGANCYFGTILSSKGGLVGIIAGAVQDSHDKSGDQCKISVNDGQAATLYF